MFELHGTRQKLNRTGGKNYVGSPKFRKSCVTGIRKGGGKREKH